VSEFSESYHLRSNNSEDAVDLLRRIGREGYVFPPANGWVTFVANECELEADVAIVANAKRPLLHYVFAEDFGWFYEIFEDASRTAMYSCSWNENVEPEDEYFSRAKLLQIVPDADTLLLDAFEVHLRPASLDEVAESEPSKLFARAVKLAHFDWLAYDYVESTMRDAPDEYPDVIAVR
jgi:hypothetical protein